MSALALTSPASWVELAYMLSALAFVVGLKRMAKVKTARQGNLLAASGMALSIAATLLLLWGAVALWIVVGGVLVGGLIGAIVARRVPMTSMPEFVALFNGLGGAASMCVALAEVVTLPARATTGELLRELTIIPSKDYQPRNPQKPNS